MILERCAEKVTILQYYFGYLPIIYDDFMYGADIWINLKIYVEYTLNKYIKAILFSWTLLQVLQNHDLSTTCIMSICYVYNDHICTINGDNYLNTVYFRKVQT